MTEPVRSVAAAIREVLLMAGPRDKIMATRALARAWRHGALAHRFDVAMPDAPARPSRPELLSPARMPRRGRAGSARARVALLHALCHIERVAIDLALDMAGRFGATRPAAFVDDWLGVAADEALHFALLDRRLAALGSGYGALPAHDGLWQAAAETAHEAAARLAVVPMVLEARGLDVTPATLERLDAAGDARSARILRRIFSDEIRHVAVGVHWFESCCSDDRVEAADRWQALVRAHFRGLLKPSFNVSARDQAGLPHRFYAPLAEGLVPFQNSGGGDEEPIQSA